ncbi:glycoside hydrolase family 105 protein [Kutzneria buriramensis]|uniref:Unsaturated rhamnogalacturonyl hydrolase n=1 Tax=Kutzneria buriramensis TaxID=1045776 RepID=A0A3E0H0U7_9PSEU|nr:glycoside hydrolase family 88 protein [Kutzneria buriramensis]REH35183.1 unsaturated rhamnogalacturonyl hydrolase [Kutzneria buriramensis]
MSSSISRRDLGRLAVLTGGLLAATAGTASAAATDWSKAVVDSTIARNPDPKSLGGWGYTQGLFLYGTYLVYQRLRTPSYLAYIKKWVDYSVDGNGHLNDPLTSLDAMQAGNLLLILHQETGDGRYRTAAQQIRTRITNYPRTSDGAMWHSTSFTQQLWCDGLFMAQPFLARYGQRYNDQTYCYQEACHNLTTYFGHLTSSTGLLFHAYSADGKAFWANKTTHTSPYHWARAIGWVALAHFDVLDVLPANDSRRAQLIKNLQQLVTAFVRYQDPATGRWFQIVDKGTDPNNWTETSASAMYTYAISRAVRAGYVSSSLQAAAQKGYQGVLQKVTLGSDGRTTIADICPGTAVTNSLSGYYSRPRTANDQHGLGTFLLMNEELTK